MKIGIAWTDFKLGIRNLAKYPGLTLVGGLGLAVAIAIGATSFEIVQSLLDPRLPLDEGERVVTLQTWDAERHTPERRVLHDFAAWRDELESVEDLGAYRTVGRNLVSPDGTAEPVRIAQMTPSGFRVARVPPLLGRTLVEEDQRPGAPPVVVIGHGVWRERFGGEPDAVGRTLRLGGTRHTVVGVMPEGFAFPVSHRFWTPLPADALGHGRLEGPEVWVFGRLGPGATMEEARSELTALGQRAAADSPETHEHLRPQVLSYALPYFDVDRPEAVVQYRFLQVLISMLLVVVAVNVAILVYARTATRVAEIAVRSALGATRLRVVGQLFVEALVLTGGAAFVASLAATVALEQIELFLQRAVGGRLPFWLDFDLSSATFLYVAGLAVLAAAIVGVLPALQATGSRVRSSLQRLGSGGSGLQLGSTWSVLIVAQVAVAVAVLPAALHGAVQGLRYGMAEPGFAAEEFLTAQLAMDRETPPAAETETHRRAFKERYADRAAELVRRLEAEPGVGDLTVALNTPGEERRVWVEVEGLPTPAEPNQAVRVGSNGHEVWFGHVGVGYFETFGVQVLTGRGFTRRDVGPGTDAVVVNRTFAEKLLGDGNPLGREVRYVGLSGDANPEAVDLGRWFRIVGVVEDFPQPVDPSYARPKLYNPMVPGEVYPATLALRVRGDVSSGFSGRLRGIAAAVDPALQLREVLPLDEVLRQEQGVSRLLALVVGLVTLSVLLLSAAGIYAMTSFAVTRRRREIGIRSALGAQRRRLLASVFSRTASQLAVGVGVGLAVAGLLEAASGGELLAGRAALLLPTVAAVMTAVGLLAALGPARRGLRIQPTEALEADV